MASQGVPPSASFVFDVATRSQVVLIASIAHMGGYFVWSRLTGGA